jgi:hypothetical protein
LPHENLAGPSSGSDDQATMKERRTRRSQVRVEALALFLESQRVKLRARGLAVTTRDGRLLAAAGPSPERLAREAVQANRVGDVATWCLLAGDVDVVLASRGGRMSHDLGSGVKRILIS